VTFKAGATAGAAMEFRIKDDNAELKVLLMGVGTLRSNTQRRVYVLRVCE
jgi:hypothetical protein